MKRKTNNTSSLLKANTTNKIITDSTTFLRDAHIDDNYIDFFAEHTINMLNDYTELIGEGTKVEYSLTKKFTKIEIRLLIPGDSYNPFTSGKDARKRQLETINSLNLNTEIPRVSYKYTSNKYETGKYETDKYDVDKRDADKNETDKYDVDKRDAYRHDTDKYDVDKRDAYQHETEKNDVDKRDAYQHDTDKYDVDKRDADKNETNKYTSGCNVITITIPLTQRRKSLLKNPMFLAVVFGVILGFACQQLPESANTFIIDDLLSPIKTKILDMISGVMGPVIFISMTTSIIAMDNINNLTNLGLKIIRRLVMIILFLMIVSLVVSAVFFHSFGTATVTFSADDLINIILDIFPSDLINPFVENNTPQLVVLGVLLGCALLAFGERAQPLNDLLLLVNEWLMNVMRIVLMLTPLIPFLSLVLIIGKGNASMILEGWELIVGTYIVFTFCVVVKAVKTTLITGINLPDFLKKIMPVVKTAFMTNSTTAPLQETYEISQNVLGIKEEFSSFWIPLNTAMLSPKTTVTLILATLMVAEMCGVNVTLSFMIVMIIVTLELSIASPGAISAWTIMFTVLGLSTDYVGLIAVYTLFSLNYTSGCSMVYRMFEEVEAAYKLGGLQPESIVGKAGRS